MACGHSAMSVHVQGHDGLPDNHPSCVIDSVCKPAASTPSLEGRMARCGYHHDGEVPSSWGLAFFEYQGPGSYSAALCTCGYAKVAHERNENRVNPEPIVCKSGGYTPRGDVGYDHYYDGCRGWD
jgi:hypothetical protein